MRKSALTVALGLSLAASLAFAPLPQEARAASTQTPWQNLTQSQLTAVWWQWALSIAVSVHPLFDATGANASVGQPYSDLLFLGGTFTVTTSGSGDVLGEVTRTISVKQGTALFFPLVNTEFDNVCSRPNLGGNCFGANKFPNNLGVPALRAAAAATVDPASGLFAQLTPCSGAACTTFTGPPTSVPFARLQSPPFRYILPATDNVDQFFGVNVSGTVAPTVADGYYSLILGTLAQGYYQLQFGGVLPINNGANTFTEKITYDITVTN